MGDGYVEESGTDDRIGDTAARGFLEDYPGDWGAVLRVCVCVHASGAGVWDYDLPDLYPAVIQ